MARRIMVPGLGQRLSRRRDLVRRLDCQMYDRQPRGGDASCGSSSNLDPHQVWPESFHKKFPLDVMPGRGKQVDVILEGISKKDKDKIRTAFVSWALSLTDPKDWGHADAVREAQQLPANTLSEMLRAVDPLVYPELDYTDGIVLSRSFTSFTSANVLDDFGIRRYHRRLFRSVCKLWQIRDEQEPGLAIHDYEVMMRCVGAAAEPKAALRIWSASNTDKHQLWRTIQTWTDMVKARFLIEPVYYQFDRMRVILRPRDVFVKTADVPYDMLRDLDRLRFSLSIASPKPWNRLRDDVSKDMRRTMCWRHNYRSYATNFRRAIYWGFQFDEEFLCASLVAFGRSRSIRDMRECVFERHYGISFHLDADTKRLKPQGGKSFAPDAPLKPTARLLEAIVEAFGAMGAIELGMTTLEYVSRLYQVPVPARVLSSLLVWTYIHSSKPISQMHEIEQRYHRGYTVKGLPNISYIWEQLMADGRAQPSTDACLCHAKALISAHRFDEALDIIRKHLVPPYRDAVDEYRKAVLDELLVNDTATILRKASFRRRAAEHRRDQLRHAISYTLALLVRKTKAWAEGPRLHTGRLTRTLIPDLLDEFDEFFTHHLAYRVDKGYVEIVRTGTPRRFRWARTYRSMLPFKESKANIHPSDPALLPGRPESWPEAEPRRIVDWRRVPQIRLASLGCAPSPVERLNPAGARANYVDVYDCTRVRDVPPLRLSPQNEMWYRRLEMEMSL